ncbi:MAG: hypothetical protein IPP69_04580 [Flavobacteriales bacterium]|nr:hypothetical protein [Flavobacteriales bacterium]
MQNPSRRLELGFTVDEIKSKIDQLIEVSGNSFQLKEKNDLFNTYRIIANFGFNVCIIRITLNSIDERKTELYSEIINSSISKDEPTVLSKYQDQFLNLLSQALNGESVGSDAVKANTSGCLGIALLLLTLTGILGSLLA